MNPPNRRRLTWLVLIVVVAAGGLLLAYPRHPWLRPSPTPGATAQTNGVPQRLQIPKIKVDAAVQAVGLTPEKDMATPSNITDVGWYRLGPPPGSPGNAVIDGHVDGASGEPGVFANLDQLAVGDTIMVKDDAGSMISFTVRGAHTYGADDHPAEVFTDKQGVHLNLITCAGSWDYARHTFTNRLVVFTDAT